MILYHFTAIELLEAILREGLSRGDVPLSPTTGQQAVWFTTDGSSAGHGLSDAQPLSEAELRSAGALSTAPLPTGSAPRFLDKRRVRIKVVIPSRDRLLTEWLPFAKKHLEPRWMDVLHRVAGGTAKARTWWLYKGVISPARFSEISIRREDGT